jgi:hypothetical protein
MLSPPRKHRFSPERRRALELLASSSGGVNAALVVRIHGSKRHVLAGLARRKLAALMQDQMAPDANSATRRSPLDCR